MSEHGIRAEIDLGALRHNIGIVRRFAGRDIRLMAVVKANAYGLGAVRIARQALASGCSALLVNDLTEALELRQAGIAAPLLTLDPVFEDEVAPAIAHDVTLTVHSADAVDLLDREARRLGRALKVHLKVDTGMNRLGAAPETALEIAWAVAERRNLVLDGVFTHLSSAVSGDRAVTRRQLQRFDAMLAELSHAGLRPASVHAANSAALFSIPEARYDMVRPGIALYGMDPGLFVRMGLDLRPVLSLKTRVALLRTVPAGASIGYEQTHRTDRPTVIATCPIGYDDGYPWQLSNKGEVIVRGRRAPVVGRVSMNYVTIDVGRIPEIEVGDEVTLVGRNGREEIRIEQLAREIGTIPYELTCRLGRRAHRVYVEESPSLPVSGGLVRQIAI